MLNPIEKEQNNLKILVLSFYFPPDIGPGALRAISITSEIAKKTNFTTSTELITAQANRYKSFETSNSIPCYHFPNTTITTIDVPRHGGTMAGQAVSFFIFVQKTLKHLKNQGQDIDLIIATSSRLMTACLAAFVARRATAKLHLDIRDLFVFNIQNILGTIPRLCLMSLLKKIERLTFEQADSISVVSPAFVPHIQKIVPKVPIWTATNGIDPEFINLCPSAKGKNKVPTILYAGNIGDGQALHRVLPFIAKDLAGLVKFKVIGDGGRREQLERDLKASNISNVEVLAPIPRNKLIIEYKEADILLLHLNNHKAFDLVIPSKVFEYAATGKPILAGVSGFSAELLKEIEGVEIFTPCNVRQMKNSLLILLKGSSSFERIEFCNKFNRSNIMSDLIDKIIKVSKTRVVQC